MSIGLAGTELKHLLERFGIAEEEGCGCGDLAALMDANGPDWCEQNIGMIVRRMTRQAKKRKLLSRVPFKRFFAKRLVKKAISRARGKQKRAMRLLGRADRA